MQTAELMKPHYKKNKSPKPETYLLKMKLLWMVPEEQEKTDKQVQSEVAQYARQHGKTEAKPITDAHWDTVYKRPEEKQMLAEMRTAYIKKHGS